MKMFNANWNVLKTEYKSITQELLEKECAEVLSNKFGKRKKYSGIASSEMKASDCGWRYYLCAGAATAGAILCHGACETTAIVTTAGLGIPACILLCGTLQAFAFVQCGDSYCSSTTATATIN